MYGDAHVRQILEDLVATACFEVGSNPKDFQIKHMGLVNRGDGYKHGWYVQVQNFDDIHAIKKGNDDGYWRYTFRSVVFSDESEPTLMVMKWMPSMGNVEDNENIHQSKYQKNDPEFLHLMTTAMKNAVI
jgi:hypothetical protein